MWWFGFWWTGCMGFGACATWAASGVKSISPLTVAPLTDTALGVIFGWVCRRNFTQFHLIILNLLCRNTNRKSSTIFQILCGSFGVRCFMLDNAHTTGFYCVSKDKNFLIFCDFVTRIISHSEIKQHFLLLIAVLLAV